MIVLILKGQYVRKKRAAQEDKNDTQQGILNKNRPNLLADYQRPNLLADYYTFKAE